MTEKMMTPLRQRMIDDMTIRNLSPSTKKIYVYAVAKFSRFHGRSPDKLTMEDVRVYRLHLIARGYQPTSINPIMGALRLFYATTLGQKDAIEHMPYARTADRLPAVLTGDEVTRFLKAVSDLKLRTLFITIYAADSRPHPSKGSPQVSGFQTFHTPSGAELSTTRCRAKGGFGSDPRQPR